MAENYSIEQIFKEHHDRMYRLALYLTRNRDDANDVVQNATVKIMEHIKDFRGESKISTWIYRITYNEAMMFFRKQSSMVTVETWQDTKEKQEVSYFYINWPQLPDVELLDQEFKRRIDTAINQMPLTYRIPLLLHNVEGFSLQETADILGLKISSLKTRVHRAFLLMRLAISNYARDKKEEVQVVEDAACPAIVGFMYDYAARTLDAKRTQHFQQHIEDCPDCTEFFDHYLQAMQITKAIKCQDIPSALRLKISKFIDEQEKDDKGQEKGQPTDTE